jgi:hypothetical protein
VREPEGNRMTAASTHGSPWKLLSGGSPRAEPVSRGCEAGVSGEEVGVSTRRARRGMGPSACTRVAEIMSGRTISQQGLATTCKDLADEGSTRGARRGLV